MHCDKDAELVKQICDFLDNNGYITIPASETSNNAFDVSIEDENHLRNTVDLFQKTLVVYTDLTSSFFRDAVDTVMSFNELHQKIHILVFNTHAAELEVPGDISIAFTDVTLLLSNGLKLLRKECGIYFVSGLKNHQCVCKIR